MPSRVNKKSLCAALTAGFLAGVALPAAPALAQKVKDKTPESETSAPAETALTTETLALKIDVAIPTIDSENSSLDEAAITAILNGDIATHAQELATLDATRITVPQILITIDPDEDDESERRTITVNDLVLSEVTDGLAASMSLGGVTLTAPEQTQVTMGAFAASNVDLAHLLGFYGLIEPSADATLRAIYSNFSFEGGTLISEELECVIGSSRGGEVRVRPLNFSWDEFHGIAQKLTDNPEEEASDSTAAAVGNLLHIYADLLTAFESEEAFSEGFECTVNAADIPITFGVGGFSMGAVRPGLYPRLTLDDIFYLEDKGSLSIEQAVLKETGLSQFIATLKTAPQRLDREWVEENLRSFVPILNGFSLTGLVMDAPPPEGTGENFQLALAAFDLTLDNYVNGIPRIVDVSADNLVFEFPEKTGDEQIDQLIAMGITGLDADFRLAANWDASASQLEVEELFVSGVDLGSVQVSASLNNVTEDLFASNPSQREAAVQALAVESLATTVKDFGLSDLIFTLAAKEQNTPPQILRPVYASIAQGAVLSVMAGAGADGDGAKLGAAINSFVSGAAKSFTIDIQAKTDPGIRQQDLLTTQNDPSKLIKLVTIDAKAE